MKKILFVALAAVGMAACVQNEELAVSKDGSAIKFDNVFVDNATKAAIDGSYTTAKGNLDHFNVWATIGNSGVSTNIFENLEVTKNGSAWTYDASLTQYWIPGNDYEFVGVVDGAVTVSDDARKMPVSIATNLSEQKDVLYATVSRTYNNGDAVTPVHLQFNHLLAKVKFTVNNVISTASSDLDYVVEGIKIVGVEDEVEYTIGGAWTANSTYDVVFGPATNNPKADNPTADRLGYGASAESNWERLILPGENKQLNIVVDYKLYKDAVCIGDHTGTETVATLDIEAGKAYNFVLALGNPGAPITFTADVTDWVEENVPVYADVTEVATAEQFETAFAHQNVNTIILGEDVVLGASATRSAVDPTLVLNNGKSITIDLNGHKLSATSSQNGNRDMFLVKGNLTIKNGTIEYQHVGENMGWNSMTTIFDVTAGGVVNLDGVTAKNLGGSDMGFVAHLNNWGKVTLNVNNSTLESNYVAVRVFNSGNDMNNVAIHNSTLKGGNYAFWVHNYTAADFGSEAKYEAHKALLNLDVFNASNTFVGKNNTPIRFGMTNSLYFGLVSTEAELKEILAAGWSVILAEDIVLEEPLKLASEKNSVIDLNGHTISATDSATGSYGLITNQGNLNVVGPGKLQLTATVNRGWNAYSSVISNTVGGNLVVDGGVVIEHLGGTDMAYGIDNLTNGKGTSAVTTIKNATVKSPYRAVRQFLNGIEATNELYVEAGAVVEGANKSIWMQDPSKNANTGKLTVAAGAQLKGDVYLFVTAGSTEWPVEVSLASAALVGESKVLTGNVPVGYDVVEENGVWTVIKNDVAATTADLQAALAEGKDVVLANDLTITPEEMPTAPYGNKMALSQNGGVFNGNGKAISVTADGDNYVLMTNGGTIKNLDIDRGFRGVVLMYPTQDVYVDHVKVGVNDEVCYTINTAEGDGTHSLYVSNSALNGWCSIGTAVKDVTFTNCTFGQGTYYTNVYGRLVKPYVDAVFDGCDFCNKCYLDLSAFVGTKVVVKNCTVNGVKITAENWASLVAPEATCEDGQISVELKNGSYLTAENVVDYIVFE